MTKKRSRAEKYVWCTCEKHQEVLLGLKFYKYLNIFAGPILIFFMVWFLIVPNFLTISSSFILMAIVYGLLVSAYKSFKKDMLAAGHTEGCSKRIAKLGVLHLGTWSIFKIIEEKKDNEASTIK